ncbi:C4-dicarboxylate ABC transporter [Pseudovibrio japonicus]|uniref:C4-dicarboxylate ABC transporter n=1 Tax=Pseudovibrio japonicus TaxID=366534 RepID=A0ABQ3DYJ5_9HYPH|nr:YfcC family protein [Pseudovibrio japonicus]GHB17715.1 C4-dicarboxylate ABC transporter [Pseudovibrio japonicus]
MSKPSFPSAFTILFTLTILVAVATWFIPAGKYDRALNEEIGKQVPVPGSFHEVARNPQGPIDVLMAPIAGLYNPKTGQANAINVSVFVLVIGGYLMVVKRTGAIDAGIARVLMALKGRERLMIPILMALFALGGTVDGMAEETLAFYALVISIMIRAGYDSLTGVAVIMLGAGVGTIGSTINPFATAIASDAAGVAFTKGIGLRLVILVVGWVLCVFWVMRYAAKVKADHSKSLIADMQKDNAKHFLHGVTIEELPEFTRAHARVLVIFVASFGLLIYGVSALDWWMAQMSTLFLASSILVAFVTRMGEHAYIDDFLDGAKDLLGVALIIGVARGIVVVMDAGSITDTVLHWSEQVLSGLSEVAFINVVFWLELLLSFFVPSSSGLAVLSMPIMAPLAGFSGVGAELVVTAFQSASGLLNLFNPTFAVVMGGLAIGRVPYLQWLRFCMPLVIMLFVLISLALSLSV